jgi:type III restriction enzyme
MELKEYQIKTLEKLKRYLEALAEFRALNEQAIALNPDFALDSPFKAWEKAEVGGHYFSRRNGLAEPLPNFCLKIPTGGGKTLLAVHAIDLINRIYRKSQRGFVLWVVPTTQIYRQTFQSLRDREHPYRQHLDIASGGRTLIVEKTDHFTPLDLVEHLVVMMLMLPSASRQNKETLKVFKDSGGFGAFFPSDDNLEEHRQFLERFRNTLDTFGEGKGFFGRQIKTSLGNTLRMLSPVIILDEGHKAYSDTAQDTLRGFNPSIIVELSATPTKASNILVDIKGKDLAHEDMIKLDLHVVNKASMKWKDTLLASVEKRNLLEARARDYEADTGQHIRPICLIQVERTGKDQRGGKFIHADDAFDYLTRIAGIDPEQVKIKSSERDDIEGLDLLSRDCPVRYIITKYALQEGWDCSFAYVLTVLTNPTSENSLTQLVGRILRQPYARKTRLPELDESYVFCFQQRGANLLKNIKDGFNQEGLGDLAGSVVLDDDDSKGRSGAEQIISLREQFRKFADKIYLPVFVVEDGSRQISYEMDILSRIDWSKADFSPIHKLALSPLEDQDTEVAVGLTEDENISEKAVIRLRQSTREVDLVFIARHLLDVVPNPWIGFSIAKTVINELGKRYNERTIVNNQVYIIEELRKRAECERDRIAEEIFRSLLVQQKVRFLVLKGAASYRLPSRLIARQNFKMLTGKYGTPIQRSLFESVPEDNLNDLEKNVAWYFDDQEKLLWWYRNMSRADYAIQGWHKHRIFADFVVAGSHPEDKSEFERVYVIETKGLHLKNENTEYKQKVFSLCNALAEAAPSADLASDKSSLKYTFEIVFENEWESRLNAIFEAHTSSV